MEVGGQQAQVNLWFCLGPRWKVELLLVLATKRSHNPLPNQKSSVFLQVLTKKNPQSIELENTGGVFFWVLSFIFFISIIVPRGPSPPSASGKEGEVLHQPAHLIESGAVAQPGLAFHVKVSVRQGFFIFIIDPHQFCISAQNSTLRNVSVLEADWFWLEFLVFIELKRWKWALNLHISLKMVRVDVFYILQLSVWLTGSTEVWKMMEMQPEGKLLIRRKLPWGFVWRCHSPHCPQPAEYLPCTAKCVCSQ